MKTIKKIERLKDLKNLSRTCFGIGRLVFQSIICNLLILVPMLCVGMLLFASPAFAVDVAPRISDKEIIEGLAELKAGQLALDAKIDKRYGELDAKIDREIANVRGDIKELKAGQNALQQQINDLRELIKWMLGILISISFTVMVIMGRILWNQQKKLTQIETSLEAQKEEISFLKTLIEKLQTLIEKLLPPRGVL